MKLTVKRLFGKLVSVRDYQVQKALKSGQPLEIFVIDENKKMTIPADELEKKVFQIVPKKFTSKFDGSEYSLYDFAWLPDAE